MTKDFIFLQQKAGQLDRQKCKASNSHNIQPLNYSTMHDRDALANALKNTRC